MRRWAVLLVVLCSSAVVSPGFAEELDGTSYKASNKGQFGVHARVGTGYRGIFRYNDEFCGQTGEDLCLGRSPFALDFGLSYRVLQRLDLLMEMRVGLESDFGRTESEDGNRIRAYAPGVKVYFSDAGTLKFFSTLQLVIDTTNYPQVGQAVAGTDYGFKTVSGLQIDPHQTIGVFFFFSAEAGFKRWLRLQMEGGLGIQARFP